MDFLENLKVNTSDMYAIIRRADHDRAFYGKWQLEAARANAILKQLRRCHGNGTECPFDRLDCCYILDLNITAKNLVSDVLNNATVIVPMTSYQAELLALFDHLGFVAQGATLCAVTTESDLRRYCYGVDHSVDCDRGFPIHASPTPITALQVWIQERGKSAARWSRLVVEGQGHAIPGGKGVGAIVSPFPRLRSGHRGTR